MTRSYARRRITRPLQIVAPRASHPAVQRLGFTCFRLVDGSTAIEMTQGRNAMFAFVAHGLE